jgi:hypothetical protein
MYAQEKRHNNNYCNTYNKTYKTEKLEIHHYKNERNELLEFERHTFLRYSVLQTTFIPSRKAIHSRNVLLKNIVEHLIYMLNPSRPEAFLSRLIGIVTLRPKVFDQKHSPPRCRDGLTPLVATHYLINQIG